ncbi:hypothetical protein BDW59DRAFT_62768 [Aspergillus cavernicola]|uniref:NAD(P)-binding protein n=1 Tax=Aspergillus cavernicola TaxID=176166 RepID=A0ABR4IFU6_9EURO
MSPNILLLGASGYIGGSTLSTLLKTHPSWNITALVRTESHASTIKSAFPFPNLSTIIGSLETPDILTTEATKASIIIQLANGDHEPGTDTLLAAIKSTATPHSKKYYIHLSGAATVLDLSLPLGAPPSRTWNDTDDLHEILKFPHSQIHAALEQKIVSFGARYAVQGVRTAIVSPPAVVGVGTGPIRRGAAYHVNLILGRGRGFVVGEGGNRFAIAHVGDVVGGILRLVEEAARGESSSSSSSALDSNEKADWNGEGYYFLTSAWGNPSKAVYVEKVLALLEKKAGLVQDGIDHLTGEEAAALHPFGPIMFGASLDIEGRRLGQKLGWRSSFENWEEAVEEEVDAELARVARGEKLGTGFGRD